MLIFSILSCISFVIYLIFGITVFMTKPASPLYRNFAYFCFCFSLWAFTAFYLSLDEKVPHDILFIKVQDSAALIYDIFILRFFIILSDTFKSRKWRVLVFGLILVCPAVFLYQNWVHNAIYNAFPAGFWYIGIHILANTYNLFSVLLLVLWSRKSSSRRVHKLVKIIIITGLITIGITLAGDYIAGFRNIPTPTPALTLLWIGALYFVIKKYKMLALSPYTVTMESLNSIEDKVVLFNPDKSINWFNKTNDDFLDKILSEQPQLPELFRQNLQISSLVKELIQNKRQVIRFRYPFRLDDMTTVYDVVIKQVKDSFDDNMGYLMRVNTVKSITSLKAFYKLRGREMEVIQLLITGLTYSDISRELRITENTVKSHITNFYSKLGVNNKIELMIVINHIESAQKLT